jgi:hypothetical protein
VNLTRAFAGLGLAALLAVTAACGSDSEKGADAPAAKETGSSTTEHTTATPEGTAMIYMKATSEEDWETVCSVTTDGEAAMGTDDEALTSCVGMLGMLFDPEDEEAATIIADAKIGDEWLVNLYG